MVIKSIYNKQKEDTDNIEIKENYLQNNFIDNSKSLSLEKAKIFYTNNDNSGSNVIIPINFKISERIPCRNPYFKNIPRPLYLLDFYTNRKICYGNLDDNKLK